MFYVAATRAEERLVIAGALGAMAQGDAPPDSWYAIADRAITGLGAAADDTGEKHFRGHRPAAPVVARARDLRISEPPAPPPAWSRQPAPIEARPPRPLAPSSMGDDAVADPPPTPAMRAAAERGRLIHALFERLPDIAPEARRAAAERWLAQVGGVSDGGQRGEIVDTVLGVLDDPRFAALFGPEALPEAPIAAVVRGGFVVSGTADRLLVGEDRVAVGDFKTGRVVPHSLDEVPAYHVRQMAAYRAALATIFPGRAIETMLLYTAGPALFTLAPALLDAQKPGFVPEQQSFDMPA